MKKVKKLNNTQQQVKMNINLNSLKPLTCPKCKNTVFRADLNMFKKLPRIQSPTGQAQLIKIELISCPACNSFYFIKDAELISLPLEEHKIKE